MGPDPGGKTDATVNSDITRTDQPSADSATSRNSSRTSNAAEGAEHRSAQSQWTTSGSDSSTRGRNSGNPPSNSTDHSQNARSEFEAIGSLAADATKPLACPDGNFTSRDVIRRASCRGTSFGAHRVSYDTQFDSPSAHTLTLKGSVKPLALLEQLASRPNDENAAVVAMHMGDEQMRKRIIGRSQQDASLLDQDWLDVERLADVEITSEDPEHPIESALLPQGGSGWRAAEPGRQTIRLLFARPQGLRRICLVFAESTIERTQEYALRWSSDGGQSFHEIVRQQWNFSPRGATCETEDYRVDLPDVTILELVIIPDTSGKIAFASLAQLRLA